MFSAGGVQMIAPITSLARVLKTDSGIEQNYTHGPKEVVPAERLEVSDAFIKWYDIHPIGRPAPDKIRQLARHHLISTKLDARGLGFLLLHRCGESFYFLIVCTWRNSNELWETVFYKDGDVMSEFRPFPRDGSHKPAFCVWELVPVWHEQQAWVRFLSSARDEAAAEEWARDQYAGEA